MLTLGFLLFFYLRLSAPVCDNGYKLSPSEDEANVSNIIVTMLRRSERSRLPSLHRGVIGQDQLQDSDRGAFARLRGGLQLGKVTTGLNKGKICPLFVFP